MSWDDFVMDTGRWVPPETASPPFWKGDDSLAAKAGVFSLAGLFLYLMRSFCLSELP